MSKSTTPPIGRSPPRMAARRLRFPSSLRRNSRRCLMATARSKFASGWGSFTALALATVVSLGCGGSGASVSGVVTLDDKPLERGTVSFTPTAGGKRATGVIDSDGGYELSTNRDAGLAAGEYSAMVVSRQPGAP